MENELKLITDLLSGSASHAIMEYTRWYFINAIAWSLLWLSGIIIVWRINFTKYIDVDWPAPAIKVGIIALLVLFLMLCLPNIFAPEAYAIHALIGDIK